MKQDLLFFLFGFLSISVFSQVAYQPYDYYECDNDNDGYVEFNLSILDSQVLGSQDTNQYYVTYHISIFEVENNLVLGGSYATYTNNLPVTIYAKVTDRNTGNYDYTSFNIDLHYSNFFPGIGLDVITCDDSQSDGITAFYGSFCCGYNPKTIHRTRQDAEQGINPLTLPFYNITPYYDRVYGREENSNGCYKVLDLYLEIRSNPTIQTPTSLVLCDDDIDGFVEFDLTEKNDEILNGLNYATITYHSSVSDAASYNYNNQKISELYTNTTPYLQTIYARATFNSNGCYTITSLDLVIQDCRDLDSDNVINSDEDINGNGNLEDDDTDKDGIPDYMDDDDDGDNINTADELIDQSTITGKSYINSKITRVFIDTDSDTIENYLDDDDDGDGILTKNEDYNNNGTPLDDDTNNNNVPDYLESSVALSLIELNIFEFTMYPNPTTEFVELTFNKNLNNSINISIYNIQGKEIISEIKSLNNGKTQLITSQLSKGIYFIKVNDGISESTKKLLIN
ncbi:T9SS type A sorting domain-containing protein [Flaviramulus sp. BrNp1-15]|uniref:T9SS type A sorting domain-containing protein n=1 Tax=Flaviramulus sp. BrNp1-15 TaxID=2916754 RepID=UPI001EE92C1F|nr:T9SS type A sorting domain-containing protein [Flaviramulus sp. BrNp1-15]ULC58840.1 T9SS type A sorting domain-containing protein [Flaviramulus sp. BrNp1-15]